MEGLNDKESSLQGTIDSSQKELDRVNSLLDDLDSAHNTKMDGINALILEAQDVKTALSEAKVIIERNLLVAASVFVETSAMASIKNRLNNINNRMRGYS